MRIIETFLAQLQAREWSEKRVQLDRLKFFCFESEAGGKHRVNLNDCDQQNKLHTHHRKLFRFMKFPTNFNFHSPGTYFNAFLIDFIIMISWSDKVISNWIVPHPDDGGAFISIQHKQWCWWLDKFFRDNQDNKPHKHMFSICNECGQQT